MGGLSQEGQRRDLCRFTIFFSSDLPELTVKQLCELPEVLT